MKLIYDVDDKIYFIIGTDAFKNIESWYETEELKKLVKFIVFTREESQQSEKREMPLGRLPVVNLISDESKSICPFLSTG